MATNRTAAELATIIRKGDETDKALKALLEFHPYYSFKPRPDLHAVDEQCGYYNSNALVSICVGGNGAGKTYVSAQKVAKFVLEQQAPPRADTPFWVLANNMDQVCQTAWQQKLHEIFPPGTVEERRITWYREKRGWPISVPLMPWKGRPNRNWVLEFKSYEQGRSSMQAAAIGGAWFTEQFPFEVFEEVLRGCREYMYPGSVFCDFTPIDPIQSAPIEAIYDRWLERDPATNNYAFFKMSADAALQAGHIDPKWYETFFATVSDEMQDTRKYGQFASYEGAIFQTFDPRIHCFDHPRKRGGFLDIPKGVWHRRAFDWGASTEHPFAALWAYRNASGQYVIYDEYLSGSQTMTNQDHLEIVKARHPWHNGSPNYGTSFGDPSRPDMIRTFIAGGVPMAAANNAVYDGIESVRKLLKPLPSLDGKPRLLIDRQNCPNLIKQLRIYRWKRSSGKGVNPQAARPEPLKVNDDLADALRYLVHSDAAQSGMLLPQMIADHQRRTASVPLGGSMHGRDSRGMAQKPKERR